jgi:hypothetical protein
MLLEGSQYALITLMARLLAMIVANLQEAVICCDGLFHTELTDSRCPCQCSLQRAEATARAPKPPMRACYLSQLDEPEPPPWRFKYWITPGEFQLALPLMGRILELLAQMP